MHRHTPLHTALFSHGDSILSLRVVERENVRLPFAGPTALLIAQLCIATLRWLVGGSIPAITRRYRYTVALQLTATLHGALEKKKYCQNTRLRPERTGGGQVGFLRTYCTLFRFEAEITEITEITS